MAMRMLFEDVKALGEGVWETSLKPEERRLLVMSRSEKLGKISIIGVLNPEFDKGSSRLIIDVNQAHPLNLGSSDRVLIVNLNADVSTEADKNHDGKYSESENNGIIPLGYGDKEFLRSCQKYLKPQIASLAERLLMKIRRECPGDLRECKNRKWVNYPDNFLAITIQNRDQSLAINVRGRPEVFSAPTLVVKDDRPGYSRFKLQHESQLEEAVSIILASARR